MHVTDEGLSFYERAKSILASVDEAETAARGARDALRGTLRVEAPFAIGHSALAQNLSDFAHRNPNLRIIVSLTNQVDNMVGRGVDVAIRMDEVEDADMIARPIFEGRYIVCASPEFLRRNGEPSSPHAIPPAACLGLTATQSGLPRDWMFRRGDEEFRLAPEGNILFNSSDALIRTAVRDGGMIYVLDILARDVLRTGELRQVLPDWDTARRTFYIAYPKSRFVSPKVRAFVEFVSSVLATPVQPNKQVRIRKSGRQR